MAKKNAGKVIQMLSPENYIRKKARTLPIYECLVNPEWQQEGMANLIVARSHTNGNITACFYLVDLYCLGLKDTHYLFNVTRTDYQEKLGTREENSNYIPISYTLAHNIVYSAIEFAEDYGFKPHKEYTSITRFMLEEDTEDVELIDIECGKDGKPLYVNGPYDDDHKQNAVIAQLERTAGPGNYDYILGDPDEGEPEEGEFDDDGLDEDEFKDLNLEEKKKLFLEMDPKTNMHDEESAKRFVRLAESIFKEFVDPELSDQYYDEYFDDLNIDLTEDEVPDEMLGIAPGSIQISDSARSLFLEIYELSNDKIKKASKLLEEFKKQTPDIPASYYLELLILQQKESKKYLSKLEEYAKKFPGYALIRMLWIEKDVLEESDELFLQTYNRNFFFPGRTSLHVEEMYNYLIFKLASLAAQDNASRMQAFNYACDDINLDENYINALDSLAILAKMHFIFRLTQQ
jgi:hypothetical protein